MKYIYSFLFLFIISNFSFSQSPEGKLFTFFNNSSINPANQVGYYEFPSGNFTQLDTFSTSDFAVLGKTLYSATGNYYQEDFPVFLYNIQTGQKIDSISHLRVKKLDFWNDKLISINNEAPFFSVSESQTPYNTIFNLDTTYLLQQPVDLMVIGNKAFLLYPSSVKIVDLIAQDTLATIHMAHPLGWGSGFNKYMVLVGEKIFIDVEYATGALRSSMMSVDTGTYQVDTTFHAEGFISLYSPIAGKDRISLYGYGSHFDIPGDSLHTVPALQPYMIAYDDSSQTDFVYNPLNDSLSLFQGGALIQQLFNSRNLIQVHWLKTEQANSIDNQLTNNSLTIFPNPSSSQITMQFTEQVFLEEVRIIDLSGRLIKTERIDRINQKYMFSIRGISSGTYIVEAITKGGIGRMKIVVSR